jgi:hypothetical protein
MKNEFAKYSSVKHLLSVTGLAGKGSRVRMLPRIKELGKLPANKTSEERLNHINLSSRIEHHYC